MKKKVSSSLSFTDKYSDFSSLIWYRLKKTNEQKNYHLKAICSSTGLGLIVDGEKVIQYAVPDFQPGRVGLYSKGSLGWSASTSKILELPNTAAFDNFSMGAMRTEDEWVKEPIDPFEYFNVKEVIYTDDFASSSAWSFSTEPRQVVKLDNEALVFYTDSDETFPWAKLNSNTGFSSGVMAETDFTIQPGSYDNSSAGFVCDVNGDWTNFYDFEITRLGVTVLKFSGGGWKGYTSVSYPIYTDKKILDTGKTYHLTGICGGGYLGMLLDGVPQFVLAIPEQQIHSIGLSGGIPYPAAEEGEATIQFDNFKLTRLEPINN